MEMEGVAALHDCSDGEGFVGMCSSNATEVKTGLAIRI